MISAVVLTKNEQEKIERCLSSLFWCDQIVVIDDYSEDETIGRIKNLEFRIKNLKIFKRRLKGDFASQRNFGMKKAKGDWILFVDADEEVNSDLAKEITDLTKTRARDRNLNGAYVKRKDFFMGRWLKYGETGNIKLIRLIKKGRGEWQGRVHEKLIVKGRVYQLENALCHYPHPTISKFLSSINWYTDLVAQSWTEKKRDMSLWEIIVYPPAKFIYNFFFRLSFLDGTAGLMMAVFMSFHSFLARAKYMWLMRK